MSHRIALSGVLAAGLALGSAPAPAAAGDAGAFIGGVAAGVLGTLAVQHAREPQRAVSQRHYVTPRAPSYQRESNRAVQTALNYFGFPAGTPDGVMGANSRAAVAQYQIFLGDPATGVLTGYEQAFLTSSYDRALSGGAITAQTIAAQGQGTRGLLVAYRQEQLGIPAPVASQAAAPSAVAPQPAAPQFAAPQPAPAVAPPAGITEASTMVPETAPAAALPSFIAGPAAPSMSGACDRTAVATSRNGGPQVYKVGATLDPLQAVDEQFCLARSYAIDDGASLAAAAQGFSAAEIETQCKAFAPSMAGHVGKLLVDTPEQVTDGLRAFTAESGIAPAQLGANARICLGVGYSTDDADVALASALVLVGLGEAAYDELVAYHLVNGYGVAARGSLGVDWLGAAADALANGAAPLVTADEGGRIDLLRTAGARLSGGETDAAIIDAKAPGAPPGSAAAATSTSAPAAMALPRAVAN